MSAILTSTIRETFDIFASRTAVLLVSFGFAPATILWLCSTAL